MQQRSSLEDSFQVLVADLVLASLHRSNPSKFKHFELSALEFDLDLRKDLDLDSLDLMQAASSVATFFNVYDSGIEDVFLAKRTLASWVQTVIKARQLGAKDFTFQSSGSMGGPKLFRHSEAWLEQEAQLWVQSLRSAQPTQMKRVLACVPSHHIYGFIWTCLLPKYAGVECLRCTLESLNPAVLRPGDVLVTVPLVWDYVVQSGWMLPAGCLGISSTAPMKQATFDGLLSTTKLAALWQIYGSSETAGIASSVDGGLTFECLPNIRLLQVNQLERITPEGDTVLQELPDRVERMSQTCFKLGARTDDVVKIASQRVSLSALESTLLACQGVAQVAVRVDTSSSVSALKACVVPRAWPLDSQQQTQLLFELSQYCERHLSQHERPRRWMIAAQLPTSALGKKIDW